MIDAEHDPSDVATSRDAAVARPAGRTDWRARIAAIPPRPLVRGAFFVFFVYLSVKLWLFYLWTVGKGQYVPRPEAVAGIIPVGAYMSLFAWVKSGIYDPVIPAGVTILLGALLLSLVFKRGFCGWVCPVGAFWEFFGWAGGKVLPRQPHAPRPVDLTLRGLRYVLAALFIAFVAIVSVQEALSFQQLPYYWFADVVIISYFFNPPLWYLAFGATVAGLSFAFGNVWCRYICPLGGIYGAIGVLSPTTVVRDDDKCIDCGKCSKVCHALVDVQHLGSVHAPECDGCQTCVVECPAPGALEGRVLARWYVAPWVWAAAAVGLWLIVYGVAVVTGHWHSPLTPEDFKAVVQQVQGIRG